jgi:hypothetical protein
VEPLEDRIALNNRFVVPVGVAIDNFATFGTLKDALDTTGLSTGNIIQIEPGSIPGNVADADFMQAFSGLTINLTIQGDPGAGLSATPQFTISDVTPISAIDTLNLKTVNLGLLGAGSLTLNGSSTIANSILDDVNSTAFNGFTLAGTTDVLTNSIVMNTVGPGSVVMEVKTPAGGSSNLISGNTFVSYVNTNAQFAYGDGSNVAITDKVVNNTFTTTALVDFYLVVQESVTGLVIQNNTFRGNAAIAITQGLSQPKNLQIVGNTIQLTGDFRQGIQINDGIAMTTTSCTIANNLISAGNSGNCIQVDLDAGTLNLLVQGNDLHNSKFGVLVQGMGDASGIDLGGGAQSSLGGNNFRSFTQSGSATNASIFTDNGTTGTIVAKHNIFGVSMPSTTAFSTGASIDATINTTKLTGNAAFVETLYHDFLKRTGDTTNAADAGNWVNALNSAMLTQAQVAAAISRSPEALGVLVDGVFVKILNRASDPGGRAGFVDFLGHGGTIEQVAATMLSSPEYAALTGSDGAFVQSVYNRLLGRVASNSEVSLWLGLLPSLGRTGMATTILSSGEFRVGAIGMLYGAPASLAPSASVASALANLLDRSVVAALELNNWASSGLDLLTLEATFASTPEYFSNG